jgi:hypothetical protein
VICVIFYRYERAKKSLSSFEIDIAKYKDFIEDVQVREKLMPTLHPTCISNFITQYNLRIFIYVKD